MFMNIGLFLMRLFGVFIMVVVLISVGDEKDVK